MKKGQKNILEKCVELQEESRFAWGDRKNVLKEHKINNCEELTKHDT